TSGTKRRLSSRARMDCHLVLRRATPSRHAAAVRSDPSLRAAVNTPVCLEESEFCRARCRWRNGRNRRPVSLPYRFRPDQIPKYRISISLEGILRHGREEWSNRERQAEEREAVTS